MENFDALIKHANVIWRDKKQQDLHVGCLSDDGKRSLSKDTFPNSSMMAMRPERPKTKTSIQSTTHTPSVINVVTRYDEYEGSKPQHCIPCSEDQPSRRSLYSRPEATGGEKRSWEGRCLLWTSAETQKDSISQGSLSRNMFIKETGTSYVCTCKTRPRGGQRSKIKTLLRLILHL